MRYDGCVTLEKKYILDLDDILAIHLDCNGPKGCHVRSSFPLSKLTRMPYECPHCHADWVLPQTGAEQALSAFISSLRGAADAVKGQRFKLNLEIRYPEGIVK